MAETMKYEFTGETKIEMDSNEVEHEVKRIRALKDLNPPTMLGEVHKNSLGGRIESEGNLSHMGECWVDEDAVVLGNAVVKGDAYVCDNSMAEGNAIISDAATVADVAVVGGYTIIMKMHEL